MWATPADEQARRARVARIARDAGMAFDAAPKLTPRLDRDARANAGRLPDDHHTRSDLTPFERVLALIENRLGPDGAAEAKKLIVEPPEDDPDKSWTRGDRDALTRLQLWARERLGPNDLSDLENMPVRMDLGLTSEGEAVMKMAGDRAMSVVRQVREAFEAEAEVGAVCGPIGAFDSAEGAYREGCKRLGVDATGTYGDGARNLFRALSRPQPSGGAGGNAVFSGAFDSSRHPANTDMSADFPGYDRISRQG